MKSYGVTPGQPRFEPIGDKAVLNCEMAFETEEETLSLQSWKSVATHADGQTEETPGTPTEFWQNIIVPALTPGGPDTASVVGKQQIPKKTHVLFFFAHTDYIKARPPISIAVSLTFREGASNAVIPLNFTIAPKMHKSAADYIFPVGWSVGDSLPAGQTWGVGQGHELSTAHRRAFGWKSGVIWPPYNSQKYAYDLTIWDAQGRRGHKEKLSVPDDYYCWRKNIYAAVTGVVTYVERDVANFGDTPINPDPPDGGNGVIIDTGSGEFFVYAHLLHGSIPADVLKGAKVYKGQLIGRLGNSGSTGGAPHLHFQVQDGGEYSVGNGLPSIFGNIEILPSGAKAFLKGSTAVPSDCAVHVLHSAVAFLGVFHSGSGGQSFTVGEDFTTFRKTIDKAFDAGLRLTSVQRFVEGVNAKFLGVFRAGSGGQSFTVGEDFTTFGKTIDKAFDAGLRLTSVQRFVEGVNAKFLGVFRAGSGGQSFTVGEDFTTFGKTIDKAFDAGLRLTSVQRFVEGVNAKFLGVFRAGSGGQSFTVGEDFTTFGKTIDKAFDAGLRLTSVQRFVEGGNAKFLGVFRAGSGGQSFTVGEDFATFGAAIDMMAAKGFRLAAVERF